VAWEVATVVAEWVVAVVSFLSELVTGSVDLRVADTTILQRTSAVSDVAQAVQVQPLWLILDILLRWILHRTMEWVQARWLVLLALVHLLLLLVVSVQAVAMAVNTSVAPRALMLFHLVSVLRQVLILDLSTPTSVRVEDLTLLDLSIAELLKPLSSLPATDPPPLDHQTSTPTRVKAIHSHSSPQVSTTCQ
jgi:hypothetical protein